MATYPLPTLAAQITATGISGPDLDAIIASQIATYQGIYGSDVVLTDDTQDLQLESTRATAINDTNNLAIAIYNMYLLVNAQGVGLDAIAANYGLQREQATNSTVTLALGGQAGTPIPAGIVQDVNQNLWNLPAGITIPSSGTITVTATAQQAGAIAIPANSNWTSYTIIPGWQTTTNAAASEPGNAQELDAPFRVRIAQAVTLPAQTPLSSIISAAANSGGIARFTAYQNDTQTTDGNGIPGHSVAVVVEGGNTQSIAQAIESKKAPGTGSFGTTQIIVNDPSGVPINISFFELTEVPIFVALTIQPLTGYASSTGTAIINAIAAYISSLPIGQTVYINQIIGAASLNGQEIASTFAITSLTIGTSTGSMGTANISIAFNAGAQGSAANVNLTVA